jgi:predicted PurR-regulated permease PerM
VLSFFPPERQEEIIYVWETAIEKMGGYIYSRILLAAINGGLIFVVMLLLGVPYAAGLAIFTGIVAAFIPVIGTYIAGAVPTLIALGSEGLAVAIVLLAYILLYQQLENYWLSPRIAGKTMKLHPAVAMGAALAGAALGGVLWAFVSQPVAATVQAAVGAYADRHEVIDKELDKEADEAEAEAEGKDGGEATTNGPRRLLGAVRDALKR